MQAGGGILPVPIYMTKNLPDIVRVLPDAFNVELDLWLLTHEDLIHTARVRTLMDFLIDSIRTDPCFNNFGRPDLARGTGRKTIRMARDPDPHRCRAVNFVDAPHTA